MARAMRRQLASFSSKESTLLMTATWARARPFATRFLRSSDGGFTGLPQGMFEEPGEAGALLRRQKRPYFQTLAVAAQCQLAPMVGRIVHIDAHPIGIEEKLVAPTARRATRNAQHRTGERHLFFASGSAEAGAGGPGQQRDISAAEPRNRPGA